MAYWEAAFNAYVLLQRNGYVPWSDSRRARDIVLPYWNRDADRTEAMVTWLYKRSSQQLPQHRHRNPHCEGPH